MSGPDFAAVMPAAQKMASYACTECGFFLPERAVDNLFVSADCPICMTARRFVRPFSVAEIELIAQVVGLFGTFSKADVESLKQIIFDQTPYRQTIGTSNAALDSRIVREVTFDG